MLEKIKKILELVNNIKNTLLKICKFLEKSEAATGSVLWK